MIKTLIIIYNGNSNDLLEQALKDTLRKFGISFGSTRQNMNTGNWEMEFGKRKEIKNVCSK